MEQATQTELEARFNTFLDVHPEAWTEFCRRVRQLQERGITHYSAKAIVEIIRFHSMVDGRDAEPWKMNNSYTAYFARKWQQENPDQAGFFETRELISTKDKTIFKPAA